MGLSKVDIKRLSKRFFIDKELLMSAFPERTINLPEYYIDKYPVTNADYSKFVMDTDTVWTYGKKNPLPQEMELLPVVSLSYTECEVYAKWAGKRLPTEEEWEKAARGRLGFLYPWGNTFDPERCICSRKDHSASLGPVNAHPNGASPWGVMDMTGNASEWTSTIREDNLIVVKGGNFSQVKAYLFMPSLSNIIQPYNASADFIGFRCVKDI